MHELDAQYPMLNTYTRTKEEWPSEKWNFQDNYGKSVKKVKAKSNPKLDEDESSEVESLHDVIEISEKKVKKLLTSVEGIGKKKAEEVLEKFDTTELLHTLETAPEKIAEEFSWFKDKLLKKLKKEWKAFKEKL